MSLALCIVAVLSAQPAPLTAREIADRAGLAYKPTADALCRMFDAGNVVRIGRKFTSKWALPTLDVALPTDPFAALDACWRARHPHPPRGGSRRPPPAQA